MSKHDARLTRLEQSSAARIARARATGDFSELSDAELLSAIEQIESRMSKEDLALIENASKADIHAIADGNFDDVRDEKLRARLREMEGQDETHQTT